MFDWFKQKEKTKRPFVRPWASMQAEFPDDAVWDEDNNLLVSGGKAATDAIIEILEQRLNSKVRNLADDGEGHGWTMHVDFRDREFWFQISDAGPPELLVLCLENSWRLFKRRPRPEHIELLCQLNAELQRDDRFHNIRWYKQEDAHEDDKGFPEPVGE